MPVSCSLPSPLPSSTLAIILFSCHLHRILPSRLQLVWCSPPFTILHLQADQFGWE